MSGLKGTTYPSDIDATKATARLPGLDIEIVHRWSESEQTEELSINLKAVPSFAALSRLIEAANPFAFWAEAMKLAWLPWLEATRAMMLPHSAAPQLSRTRSERPDGYLPSGME